MKKKDGLGINILYIVMILWLIPFLLTSFLVGAIIDAINGRHITITCAAFLEHTSVPLWLFVGGVLNAILFIITKNFFL